MREARSRQVGGQALHPHLMSLASFPEGVDWLPCMVGPSVPSTGEQVTDSFSVCTSESLHFPSFWRDILLGRVRWLTFFWLRGWSSANWRYLVPKHLSSCICSWSGVCPGDPAQDFLFVTDSSIFLITCLAVFLLTFLSLDLHKLLEFVGL